MGGLGVSNQLQQLRKGWSPVHTRGRQADACRQGHTRGRQADLVTRGGHSLGLSGLQARLCALSCSTQGRQLALQGDGPGPEVGTRGQKCVRHV